MSEKVEQVARAIFEKHNEVCCVSWEDSKEWERFEYRELATAAISAMQEPTEAMVSTAGLIDIERPGNDETNSTFNLTNEEIEFVWYAMIDTALGAPK